MHFTCNPYYRFLKKDFTKAEGNNLRWKKFSKKVGKTVFIPSFATLENEFGNLSIKERKHLQSALKQFNFYTSSQDGIYGQKTQSAIAKYIIEKVFQDPSKINMNVNEIYKDLMSQVKYVHPKIKVVKKFETNKYRFLPLTSNPSKPARQAYEICQSFASSAALAAGNSNRSNSYSTDCLAYKSNYISCSTTRGSGGGFAAGFASGLSRMLAASNAKKAAFGGCMAEHGWSVKRK